MMPAGDPEGGIQAYRSHETLWTPLRLLSFLFALILRPVLLRLPATSWSPKGSALAIALPQDTVSGVYSASRRASSWLVLPQGT